MNASKWTLLAAVVVVGAAAGLLLGGRPATLPDFRIPTTTSTVSVAESDAGATQP